MPTVFLKQIDSVLIDANGVRTPAVSKTIVRYNETAAAALSSVTSDTNGIIAASSITANVNDVIRYSHATYPEVVRLRATATAVPIFDPDYPSIAYVMQNLATLAQSEIVDLYAYDLDNPTAAPELVGSGRSGDNVAIPMISTVLRNLKIVPVSSGRNRKGQIIRESPLAQTVAITATGGTSVDLASTTELLTGTNAVKVVTPDVLAALWEQGPDIASAATISIGEGGQFNVTGTTTITDIDFATDKAGRTVWLKFAGAGALIHSATLILPGAASLVTTAGDMACFRSEGSDIVRCIAYTKANGSPLVLLTDGTHGDIIVVDGGDELTIAANAVVTYKINDDAVTNAKAANMATKTYKGRTSALTGDPEDVAVATLKTDLILVKGDVGLGNVDNTSDVNKPVSTAQQTALNAKKTDSMTTARILGRTTAGTGVIEEISVGTGLSLSGGSLASTVAGLTDGDKGDIVLSGSGSVYTIDANVVTNAKAAQMATKTYKGRTSASTGDAEDVAVATLKTDLVLVKGDVGLGNVDNTSDANKPVSTAQQTALNAKKTDSMATARILGRTTAGAGVIEEITVGTGLSLTGGSLAASGGGGDAYGPGSSVDKAIARFDGTTGKLLQTSAPTIADTTGIIAGTQGINIAGSTSGAVNLRVPAAAGSNTLTLPAGSTDFSTTGGSKRFVRQDTAGAPFTVDSVHGADLTLNLKTVFLEQYAHTNAGLTAAISAILATRTKLVITEDLTISTTQTIPSTCLVSIENGAQITVSGSATLTIGKMVNPGNVRLFVGVNASNHVRFSKGAVERLNLAWFEVADSGANCTYAMQDMLDSLYGYGGVIYIPNGRWRMDNVQPYRHIKIQGESQGYDDITTGTVLQKYTTGTAGAILKLVQGFVNITICDLSISTEALTNQNGVLITGVEGGASGFAPVFHGVTFFCDGAGLAGASIQPQCYIQSTSGVGWECVQVFFDSRCQFYGGANSDSLKIAAYNSQVKVHGSRFNCGTGDGTIGIHAANCLSLHVDGADFRGQVGTDNSQGATDRTFSLATTSGSNFVTGIFKPSDLGQRVIRTSYIDGYVARLTSTGAYLRNPDGFGGWVNANASATDTGTATMYRFTDSSTASGTCIKTTDVGSVIIENCEEESFNRFWKNGVGLYRQPIIFKGNYVQDRMESTYSVPVLSLGNHYNSNAWNDGSTAVSIITSIGDVIEPGTTEGVLLLDSNFWGPRHGVGTGGGESIVTTQLGYETGAYQQQHLGFYTKLLVESEAGLERPSLEILSTASNVVTAGQTLLRLGLADPITKAYKYGWSVARNPSTGWAVWTSNNGYPYNAWTTDFPLGYDSTAAVNVTQTTSRTTAVTVSYGMHGIITCYDTTSLPAGGFAVFQFFNTLILPGHFVDVEIVGGSATEMVTADIVKIAGGYCKILVKNRDVVNADTGTLKIKYWVRPGGKQDGSTTY